MLSYPSGLDISTFHITSKFVSIEFQVNEPGSSGIKHCWSNHGIVPVANITTGIITTIFYGFNRKCVADFRCITVDIWELTWKLSKSYPLQHLVWIGICFLIDARVEKPVSHRYDVVNTINSLRAFSLKSGYLCCIDNQKSTRLMALNRCCAFESKDKSAIDSSFG